MNYIARHWRGELSVPVSFWVNGLLLNLALISVRFWLDAAVADGTVSLDIFEVLAIYAAAVGIWIWQAGGILKSIKNYTGKHGVWVAIAAVLTRLGVTGGIIWVITEGALIIAAAVPTSNSTPYATDGAPRRQFISEYTAACTKEIPAGVTPDQQRRYCNCMAVWIANNVTKSELDKAHKGATSDLKSHMDSHAEQCRT